MSPKKKFKKKFSEPKDGSVSDKDAMDFVATLRKQGQLGDISKKLNFISTGSWVIDRLIGDGTHQNKPGGAPRGYVMEIFGDEACGKTTLGLHIARQAQLKGDIVVYADFEKGLRAQQQYVRNIGVDTNPPRFIHIVPDSLEEGVKIIGQAVVQLKPSVVIIDSVPAMLPRAAFETSADEGVQIGLHAKLVGHFLNWICKKLGKYDCSLVLINQLRSNIKTDKYERGPKEITTGGRALRYYTAVRLRLRNNVKYEVEQKSDITGTSEKKAINQTVKVMVVKNKIDMPFKSGPIYIAFGQGVDNVLSLIDLAVHRKVIKKGGAWYEWNDPNSDISFKLQGQQSVKRHLEEHPEILEALKPYLMPTTDQQEVDTIQDELESKGLDSLNRDELDQLKQIRQLKGLPVDDIDGINLSEEQLADLKELDGLG